MKKTLLLFMLILFSSSLFAKQFYPVKLIYTAGKIDSGLASVFKKPGDKFISFKSNKESKAVRIVANDLKSITYYFGGKSYEFYRMIVYKNNLSQKKIYPAWIMLIKKGFCSLYVISFTQTWNVNGSYYTFTDSYFLCYREGEKAATMISDMDKPGNLTPNWWFHKYGPKYFKDYPDLAQKIENSTYTNVDLIKVLDIYNDWAEKNKTK